MSLNFTSNGYLNVNASASTDLFGGASCIWANAGSFLCWVLMNNIGPAGPGTFVRANGAGNGNFIFSPTTTSIQISQAHATQSLLAFATFANMPALVAKQWACVAATWDPAGTSAQQQLWSGNQKYPLAEALAYVTQRLGTGGATSAAGNPAFGNAAGGGLALDGLLAYAVAFNRRLSLPELQWMQFHPLMPLPGCVGMWNLDADSGATYARDWTGRGSTGIATGSAVGAGASMPGTLLRMPRARFLPFGVTATFQAAWGAQSSAVVGVGIY